MNISRLSLWGLLLLALLFSPLRSISQTLALPEDDVTGPRNAFKITLLSLGSGSSRFTYERAFGLRNCAEFTVGIIGWGWDWMNDTQSRGLLFKLAYKWNLVPMQRMQTPLAGFYVKPELVYADFAYRDRSMRPKTEYHVHPPEPNYTRQVALLAECGYQLLFNWFVFDIYTGLGPSFGTDNDNNYFHSFMLMPTNGHLAFTAGFRIGIAF